MKLYTIYKNIGVIFQYLANYQKFGVFKYSLIMFTLYIYIHKQINEKLKAINGIYFSTV